VQRVCSSNSNYEGDRRKRKVERGQGEKRSRQESRKEASTPVDDEKRVEAPETLKIFDEGSGKERKLDHPKGKERDKRVRGHRKASEVGRSYRRSESLGKLGEDGKR